MDVLKEIIELFKNLDTPVQIVFIIGAIIYLLIVRYRKSKPKGSEQKDEQSEYVKRKDCKEIRNEISEGIDKVHERIDGHLENHTRK